MSEYYVYCTDYIIEVKGDHDYLSYFESLDNFLIPNDATSILFNGLCHLTYAEIRRIFAAMPASVTSLDLSNNVLHRKTREELTQTLAVIPSSVTSLNLAGNFLGSKSGAKLAQALAAIPAGVNHLDLSFNNLHIKTGAQLAQFFMAIPAGVTSLDLSYNDLDNKTDAELAQAFAAILPGTKVILKGNNLFKNKTPLERDNLLTTLRLCNPNIYLDLSGNGESDAQRAVVALSSATRCNTAPTALKNPDVTSHIMRFFTPKNTHVNNINNMFAKANSLINNRNNNQEPLQIENSCAIK
jgi:hypothetical protein